MAKSKSIKKDTSKKEKPKKKTILYSQEQQDFVRFYIENRLRNAGGAYMRAYPKTKNPAIAYSCASKLLRTAKIQTLLKEKIEEATGKLTENLSHQLLSMWVTRAFYDPADVVNENGELCDTMEGLKEKGLSVCIEGIEVKPDKDGMEHLTYKLADRKDAMDNLQKYIGLIKPLPTLNLNLNKDATDLTPDEEKAYQENMKAIFPQLGEKK